MYYIIIVVLLVLRRFELVPSVSIVLRQLILQNRLIVVVPIDVVNIVIFEIWIQVLNCA